MNVSCNSPVEYFTERPETVNTGKQSSTDHRLASSQLCNQHKFLNQISIKRKKSTKLSSPYRHLINGIAFNDANINPHKLWADLFLRKYIKRIGQIDETDQLTPTMDAAGRDVKEKSAKVGFRCPFKNDGSNQ